MDKLFKIGLMLSCCLLAIQPVFAQSRDTIDVARFFPYRLTKETLSRDFYVVDEEPGKYYLIGGSYPDIKAAKDKINELSALGFLPFVIYNSGAKAYRVVVERAFDSQKKAEDDMKSIKKLYNINTWIYSSPPAKK